MDIIHFDKEVSYLQGWIPVRNRVSVVAVERHDFSDQDFVSISHGKELRMDLKRIGFSVAIVSHQS